MRHPVDPGDMAPAAAAALRAEQLLQPFIAEHQHRIGLDHQLCPFVAHAPRLQLLRREQMQEILLAVALDPLLRVGRAEQLTPLWSAVVTWLGLGGLGVRAGQVAVVRCAAQGIHWRCRVIFAVGDGALSGGELCRRGLLSSSGGELQQHLNHPLLLGIAEFREDRQAEHL
jgi:hypothetical protein